MMSFCWMMPKLQFLKCEALLSLNLYFFLIRTWKRSTLNSSCEKANMRCPKHFFCLTSGMQKSIISPEYFIQQPYFQSKKCSLWFQRHHGFVDVLRRYHFLLHWSFTCPIVAQFYFVNMMIYKLHIFIFTYIVAVGTETTTLIMIQRLQH